MITPEKLGRRLWAQWHRSDEDGSGCLSCPGDLYDACQQAGMGELYLCADFVELLRLLNEAKEAIG